MQRAATLDDVYFEQSVKQSHEQMNKLLIENQGLRELLKISKSIAKDAEVKKCVETQTDEELLDTSTVRSDANATVDGHNDSGASDNNSNSSWSAAVNTTIVENDSAETTEKRVSPSKSS